MKFTIGRPLVSTVPCINPAMWDKHFIPEPSTAGKERGSWLYEQRVPSIYSYMNSYTAGQHCFSDNGNVNSHPVWTNRVNSLLSFYEFGLGRANPRSSCVSTVYSTKRRYNKNITANSPENNFLWLCTYLLHA
jgi:hypothetical protein